MNPGSHSLSVTPQVEPRGAAVVREAILSWSIMWSIPTVLGVGAIVALTELFQ